MHIAYLIEHIDNAGGIQRGLITRANYLVEKYNFDIDIYCTNKTTGIPHYKLDPRVKIIFLEKLTTKKSFLGRILLQYKQAKTIVETRPDVIISVKFTLHNFFFQLLRKRPILISELREPKEQYYQNNRSFKSKLYNFFRKGVFGRQDLLITLTDKDKKEWGFSNIEVVNNFRMIEAEKTSDLSNKQVLAVSRLHKVKGLDYLIKAWSIIHARHPDWTLKICGQGDEYVSLKNQIKGLELEQSIILNNESVDVIPEYLSSSIFVLTSKYEAFGNVLVEAQTFGLPIVSFDAPSGPREIISDEADGFLVPLFDIDLLAEKIILLIENEDLRKKMGENGVQNSKRFDFENIMGKYISLITKF